MAAAAAAANKHDRPTSLLSNLFISKMFAVRESVCCHSPPYAVIHSSWHCSFITGATALCLMTVNCSRQRGHRFTAALRGRQHFRQVTASLSWAYLIPKFWMRIKSIGLPLSYVLNSDLLFSFLRDCCRDKLMLLRYYVTFCLY